MQQNLDTGKPYSDIHHDKFFIRTFELNVESDELIWHRDKKNRIVTVISGEGWKLQMDNEIPLALNPNSVYNISKETYHRITKGTTNLVLKIQEYD